MFYQNSSELMWPIGPSSSSSSSPPSVYTFKKATLSQTCCGSGVAECCSFLCLVGGGDIYININNEPACEPPVLSAEEVNNSLHFSLAVVFLWVVVYFLFGPRWRVRPATQTHRKKQRGRFISSGLWNNPPPSTHTQTL